MDYDCVKYHIINLLITLLVAGFYLLLALRNKLQPILLYYQNPRLVLRRSIQIFAKCLDYQ